MPDRSNAAHPLARGAGPHALPRTHSSSWFLPVVTLIILAATAGGVVWLSELSRSRIGTAALLNRVEAEANELSALEHEAVAHGGIVSAELLHVEGEVEEALDQLEEPQVREAWNAYRQTAADAFGALGSGGVAEARAVSESRVDLAFDALHVTIEEEIDHQAELAARWGRAADIGTFALALLAAVLLGGLFRRYHRVQRRHHDDLLHDPLTRLANRILFQDRLNQALARARRNRTSLAIMFIDLD